MFSIEEEGILLKKIPLESLDQSDNLVNEILEKSDKIGVDTKNIEKAKKDYQKTQEGGLDLI